MAAAISCGHLLCGAGVRTSAPVPQRPDDRRRSSASRGRPTISIDPANCRSVAMVSDSDAALFSLSFTTTAAISILRRATHLERRQGVAQRADIAAGDQHDRNAQQPTSSRARCAGRRAAPSRRRCPSISSTPRRSPIASRVNATSSSKSMSRSSSRAAMSGDSGALNRQGAMRSISGSVTGRPSARQQGGGIAVLQAPRRKSRSSPA